MKVIQAEISKLSLKPGDFLVMRINTKNYTQNELQKVRKTLSELRPRGIKIILLDTDFSIGVISPETLSESDLQMLLDQDLFHNERSEYEVPDSNEY